MGEHDRNQAVHERRGAAWERLEEQWSRGESHSTRSGNDQTRSSLEEKSRVKEEHRARTFVVDEVRGRSRRKDSIRKLERQRSEGAGHDVLKWQDGLYLSVTAPKERSLT